MNGCNLEYHWFKRSVLFQIRIELCLNNLEPNYENAYTMEYYLIRLLSLLRYLFYKQVNTIEYKKSFSPFQKLFVSKMYCLPSWIVTDVLQCGLQKIFTTTLCLRVIYKCSEKTMIFQILKFQSFKEFGLHIWGQPYTGIEIRCKN